ncbi:hypothetical protein DI09_106p40 [Mitosporidium daphniae]|uniref:Uncharacterized protein n=1 Tax=Mitosporidium daphniae TaxID=1485682 RepID=A0A098VW85_9MICR|nr:uncharacterized protein DI09_106p40 [Mitosporidium daphniae]KGG53180.1 hypothetical protein DI09_106p40 [Mitosporidium daphniae]|eukprot:XP_013239616.1 uncharacterized protein DI09_106p40 [Mitosporidium daphniae]
MEYDGAAISLVCFFLAAKVENVHISLEDILAKIGQASASKLPPIDRLFQLEIDLANTLEFQFRVELFYDVLYGFSLILAPTYPTIFDIHAKTLERLALVYHLAPGWWLSQTNGALLGMAALSIELTLEQKLLLENSVANYGQKMCQIGDVVGFLLELSSENSKKAKDFDYKRISQLISSCKLMEQNMETSTNPP